VRFRAAVHYGEHMVGWALIGEQGATSLSAMLYPRESGTPLGSEGRARELGFVLTDAGWLMPTDLGLHCRQDDPRAGLLAMDECPWLEAPCWYGGSSLASWAPMAEWERSGFRDGVIQRVLEAYYAGHFGEDAQ
jgi:hypothetical protein